MLDVLKKSVRDADLDAIHKVGYYGYHNLSAFDACYKYVAEVIGGLPGVTRVLEIGCHRANLVQFLPEPYEYIGFDVSEVAIEEAKMRWTSRRGVCLFQASLETVFDTVSSLEVDVVLSGNCFIYLRPETMVDCVKEYCERTGASYFILYEIDRVKSGSLVKAFELVSQKKIVLDLPNEVVAKRHRKIEVYKIK